jgi:hypothetical protein
MSLNHILNILEFLSVLEKNSFPKVGSNFERKGISEAILAIRSFFSYVQHARLRPLDC